MTERPPLYSPLATPTANWYRASQVDPLLDRLLRYEQALKDISEPDDTSTLRGAVAIAIHALKESE